MTICFAPWVQAFGLFSQNTGGFPGARFGAFGEAPVTLHRNNCRYIFGVPQLFGTLDYFIRHGKIILITQVYQPQPHRHPPGGQAGMLAGTWNVPDECHGVP